MPISWVQLQNFPCIFFSLHLQFQQTYHMLCVYPIWIICSKGTIQPIEILKHGCRISIRNFWKLGYIGLSIGKPAWCLGSVQGKVVGIGGERLSFWLLLWQPPSSYFTFTYLSLSWSPPEPPRVVSFSAANNHRRATSNLLVTTETEIAPSPKHSRCEPSQAPHQKRKILQWVCLRWMRRWLVDYLVVTSACLLATTTSAPIYPDWLQLARVAHCLCYTASWWLRHLGCCQNTMAFSAKWWVENWGFWLGCWNEYYTNMQFFHLTKILSLLFPIC